MEGLEYINSLIEEGRGYRSEHLLTQAGLRSTLDKLYLAFLALQIANQDEAEAKEAQHYAKQTLSGMRSFANSSTDLGGLIALINDADDIDWGRNKEINDTILKRIDIDNSLIKSYLNRVASGRLNLGQDRQFFLALESDLSISDPSLRAMRRLGVDWSQRMTADRQLVATRWLQMMRAKFNRFDFGHIMVRITRRDNLELAPVSNVETGKVVDPKKNPVAKPSFLRKLGWGAVIAAGLGIAAAKGWEAGRTKKS